jgi:flagellar hook-basal body complex protein FliE
VAIEPTSIGAGSIGTVTPAPTAPAASGTAGAGFSEALGRVVNAVETTTSAANTAVANMLEGTGDVHDAMIALQRAEMTFELTVQMRNKLIQAYQDIMRMPV